jgi:hypothetical protein
MGIGENGKYPQLWEKGKRKISSTMGEGKTEYILNYTVRCDELKLTLGNLFLCYMIGIFS